MTASAPPAEQHTAPDGPGRPPGGTSERRIAAWFAAGLLLLGALLGVLWELVSPPGPLGVRLPAGIQADESEAFINADGWFAVIVVVVGLLAGTAAWFTRRARGVLLAVALTVGGLGGALLTDLVGHLLRGQGRSTVQNGLTYYAHLPLEVHMTGLLLFEPAVALTVYAVCVAFAARDDLGRPDGAR